MKKVLFTATVDSHILQFHIPYLKMFKEKGYKVYVATNGDEKIPYCDKKYKIPFARSPLNINNIKAIGELKKIIEEEKFDVIHTHTPMGSAVTRIASIKARKKLGTRVMYTVHGLHFFKGAPKKNWIIFYPVEKILSNFTDDLITINKEDYEFAKKNMNAKNLYYVPGVGVDKDKFKINLSEEEKDNIRKEVEVNKNDFVMTYPAELIKRKNQEMLINVMEKLVKEDKNIKLLLPGYDSLNGEMQKEVSKRNLEDNIKFLGYRKDIPRLLKISNLAVSSSKQEGLPVNLMEAMASNLPIVATDCRGNRDLVQNGENGYIVKIDDVDDMIDKIKKIKNKEVVFNFDKTEQEMLNEISLDNIRKKMEQIYNFDNN